ncbi:MAG: amino acid-binding protein [Lachnospiraceae bacterium]|nr:amino acid-binding protein [Lachnospiraceae bacterium]
MALKQLSVFLENREGRLEDLFQVFEANNIEIHSFSLAESSEYGILRLIVSNPEIAKEELRAVDFSASLTDVVAVRLPGGFDSLKSVTDAVTSEYNIEYMYVLSTEKDKQAIVFKIKNVEEVEKSLEEKGFTLIN